MDHGFQRPMEPWECTDGCVFLVREIAKVPLAPTNATTDASSILTTVTQASKDKLHKLIIDKFEPIIDVALIDHFKHSAGLKENLFKTLAELIQPNSMGKKKVRGYLDMMVEPSFRNCKNAN